MNIYPREDQRYLEQISVHKDPELAALELHEAAGDIQSKAAAMGMIPASEAETIQIQVHLPEETPELTWWEDLVWLWKGMFE